MNLDNKALAYAVVKTGIPANKVISTCNLLFIDSATIPFIARYRKEVTGNLDEVEIRKIQEFYEEYIEIEKRREFILDTIKKMEKLTPELKAKIEAADSLNVLEDLYAPYKSKKKTKGQIARDQGLEPLANLLLSSKEKQDSLIATIVKDFVGKDEKIKTLEDAMNGAFDIIMEDMAHHVELKERLRNEYWAKGKISTEKRKEADTIEEASKFKDFFEFSEPVSALKDPKNSHRYLAMRRGMNLKVLKVDVAIDSEYAYQEIENTFFKNGEDLPFYDQLKKCAKKAYDNAIAPSLDLELKTELKKIADNAAIDVFGINLKNLLLQPYLGSKAVLGIDPGIRTGCKVVIIDKTGKFIGDHVVYPFAPKFDVEGSKTILTKMIEMFDIEYIAIGNGTNGRETLEFVEDHIDAVKNGKVKATMVNEAGASIYSASEIARAEFPDKDVTVRGAVSIARRFQDPLGELVKIDPKSIGVGQYQHDVNQVTLKKSLEGVVESCVNYVGVDLNTASAPLLSYISGVGPSVAANIVSHRDKNGLFKTREELLKVSRLTPKVFEQAAGFLRIYNGTNPLDATFIHPERYPILVKWAQDKKVDLLDLLTNDEVKKALESDKNLEKEIGHETFQDIVKSLKAKAQDPRSEFKSVEFRKDVRDIKDLKIGEWYTGVVNNLTNFGAFVDIGIKESGLLHVSEISNEFVANAMDKLKVGEELKVKVLEIDYDRRRISLSCKTDSKANYDSKPSQGMRNPNQFMNKGPKQGEFKNNPFANLKLK